MIKNNVATYHKSIDHALDLMEQFHDDVDEFGVTELSKRLNLSKNSVFRLLATLESRHYIKQNEHTGSYRLGLKALELGQTFIKQTGLVKSARPIIETLTRECRETSFVAIRKDFHMVFLDTVETDQIVRIVPRIGVRLPLHSTAAGKILLAAMTGRDLDSYFLRRVLNRYTPDTITDKTLLRKHLSKVAEQRFAVDNEEHDSGVRSVSAPILDYTRRIVGAASISGPSMRFSDIRLEQELIPLVRKAAEEISVKLGYRGNVASCLPDIASDSIVRRLQTEFCETPVNLLSLLIDQTPQQLSGGV